MINDVKYYYNIIISLSYLYFFLYTEKLGPLFSHFICHNTTTPHHHITITTPQPLHQHHPHHQHITITPLPLPPAPSPGASPSPTALHTIQYTTPYSAPSPASHIPRDNHHIHTTPHPHSQHSTRRITMAIPHHALSTT
jgi:hypothetical protein